MEKKCFIFSGVRLYKEPSSKKLIIDNQNRFWGKEYNSGTLIGTEFQPEDT